MDKYEEIQLPLFAMICTTRAGYWNRAFVELWEYYKSDRIVIITLKYYDHKQKKTTIRGFDNESLAKKFSDTGSSWFARRAKLFFRGSFQKTDDTKPLLDRILANSSLAQHPSIPKSNYDTSPDPEICWPSLYSFPQYEEIRNMMGGIGMFEGQSAFMNRAAYCTAQSQALAGHPLTSNQYGHDTKNTFPAGRKRKRVSCTVKFMKSDVSEVIRPVSDDYFSAGTQNTLQLNTPACQTTNTLGYLTKHIMNPLMPKIARRLHGASEVTYEKPWAKRYHIHPDVEKTYCYDDIQETTTHYPTVAVIRRDEDDVPRLYSFSSTMMTHSLLPNESYITAINGFDGNKRGYFCKNNKGWWRWIYEQTCQDKKSVQDSPEMSCQVGEAESEKRKEQNGQHAVSFSQLVVLNAYCECFGIPPPEDFVRLTSVKGSHFIHTGDNRQVTVEELNRLISQQPWSDAVFAEDDLIRETDNYDRWEDVLTSIAANMQRAVRVDLSLLITLRSVLYKNFERNFTEKTEKERQQNKPRHKTVYKIY